MATDRSASALAGVVGPTAEGWRLVVVPGRVRELLSMLGSGVLVPLIALPLLLPVLVVALVSGYALVWGIVWVVLGIMALAAILIVAVLLYTVPAGMVRWVEFRPRHVPPQVEIARFLRRSTLAMDDLQRIVVVEQTRLGLRKSITVTLHSTGGRLECRPAASSPLALIDAGTLTDWLTGELTPCAVEVEHRTEAQRNFSCPEEWLAGPRVAALWQVPLEAVDETAAHHGVRSHTYTPRASAMYNPGNSITVYDPAPAYEVAETLRTQRATQATE
ncbi:hypothetical protein [Streptomyces sp. NBC_00568]|uniref:hypothetical protein n=1 Tax=Streptomyces sp. NBC_00568 TaxID=2975779 RepID=UPI0022573A81|nr:hypothetical protein [Streptomyces sp. NBC_00568]MCX4993334.1 hypothetical protein [Streptomyces sp. NBC_00568]